MSPGIRAGGPSIYGLGRGSDVGGELYERELVRRLPAHGVRVLIGMPPGHGLEPVPGVRAIMLPRPGRMHWTWAPLWFVPWTVALVLGDRVDVLRAPSVRYAGPSLLAARALCRGRRTPVAIHHHHFEPRWRRLEAAILRRADLVLTVSEHSRAELVAGGVEPARIRLAYNGIDGPPVTDPEPAATWPGDGLRLLCLGRLEDRKRPELALDTLAALLRDHGAARGASLVVAGEGPAHAALQEHALRLGITERVRFLGRVADARKWRLYDGAQLLLFGSTLEGFGLVVAEAQSRGLPVIAAAGTATGEAMLPGESGLLVAPLAEAFAAAAAELLAPGRRAAMGQAAREFAARFTWEACAASVASALRETVDGGPLEAVVAEDAVSLAHGSEPYDPDNWLDRLSSEATLARHYRVLEGRERQILDRRLRLRTGRVLSVGAGWHPGRHLFPAPDFSIVAVDADLAKVEGLAQSGAADEVHHGHAGGLDELPDESFDVVLYRLVLHHIVFQGPLAPAFAEAARLLRPGGALVAIEPGLWHPVGAALALANRLHLGELAHGTPDDVPLSPRELCTQARTAGLVPELHAVSYAWRRLPPRAQHLLGIADGLGSRPRTAPFGHTLMLIARRP